MNKLRFCCLILATAGIAASPQWSLSQSRELPTALKLRALRAEPGKVSLYELSFTTKDTLDSKAEMTFNFPPAFDLSALEIASSTNINGGFKILKEGNRVTVRRTGLGDPVPPGREVSLQLGLIKNPPDIFGAHEVAFEIASSLRPSRKIEDGKAAVRVQFITR